MISLDSVIPSLIQDRVFPGCVIGVGNQHTVRFRSYGLDSYDDGGNIVNEHTVYDLASLTKVISTATLAMISHDRGEFHVLDRVGNFIPEFRNGRKSSVTIFDLLTHQSGLPPYLDLTLSQLRGKDVTQRILKTALTYTPRTESQYSCLGFIVLARILENVSGISLHQLFKTRIKAVMGWKQTDFCPSEVDRIAPTTVAEVWHGALSGSYLKGLVHDPLAYLQGGISGNAGLFGSCYEIAQFAQMLLAGGRIGSHEMLQVQTISGWTKRQTVISTRALGWDTPSDQGSSAGTKFSNYSFGHTGYTGTSLWVDPIMKRFVILLTNRVHPRDESKQLVEWRGRISDLALQDLGVDLSS